MACASVERAVYPHLQVVPSERGRYTVGMLPSTRLATQNGENDPLALLRACHGRIRSFLATARRIAEAEGAPDQDVREAATAVQRYFHVALPLHVLDEDESVEPRLRGSGTEPGAGLDAALGRMTAEHREMEPLLERLVALCDELRGEPGRLSSLRGELRAVLDGVEPLMARHLESEEKWMFPAVAELDAAVRAELFAEFRGRRGANPQQGITPTLRSLGPKPGGPRCP